MNNDCRDSILSKDNDNYDFTLFCLKEIIINNSNNLNEFDIVQLSINELITLQNEFLLLTTKSRRISEEYGDLNPLETILKEIDKIKIHTLDNTSNIQNFVLNFYIKPNKFYYDEDVKIYKCPDCILPVPAKFFKPSNLDEFKKDVKWECLNCKNGKKEDSDIAKYDDNEFQCKVCKQYRVFDNESTCHLIKRYNIPKSDEDVINLEDVLFKLPELLYEDDDINVAVNTENKKLSLIKDGKHKNTIKLFQDFLAKLVDTKTEEGKNKIKNLMKDVEVNYFARDAHRQYLDNVNELITFINNKIGNGNVNSNNELAKRNRVTFVSNILQGYSNDFVKTSANKSSFIKYLKNMENPNSKGGKNQESNKNTVNTFLVVKLINEKVINFIKFEDKDQPKLEKKSSLTFEKQEGKEGKYSGYKISLNYKEVFRRFIFCEIESHEYILDKFELGKEDITELRRIAWTNATFDLFSKESNKKIKLTDPNKTNPDETGKKGKEEKEPRSIIRFNIFYLVNLLNSLEAD